MVAVARPRWPVLVAASLLAEDGLATEVMRWLWLTLTEDDSAASAVVTVDAVTMLAGCLDAVGVDWMVVSAAATSSVDPVSVRPAPAMTPRHREDRATVVVGLGPAIGASLSGLADGDLLLTGAVGHLDGQRARQRQVLPVARLMPPLTMHWSNHAPPVLGTLNVQVLSLAFIVTVGSEAMFTSSALVMVTPVPTPAVLSSAALISGAGRRCRSAPRCRREQRRGSA